jgi:hypothetical protein
MADKTAAKTADETRVIIVNKGTSAEWTAQVRPLESGELGFNTDTGELKIGDGVHSFNSLSALNPSIKVGDVIIR